MNWTWINYQKKFRNDASEWWGQMTALSADCYPSQEKKKKYSKGRRKRRRKRRGERRGARRGEEKTSSATFENGGSWPAGGFAVTFHGYFCPILAIILVFFSNWRWHPTLRVSNLSVGLFIYLFILWVLSFSFLLSHSILCFHFAADPSNHLHLHRWLNFLRFLRQSFQFYLRNYDDSKSRFTNLINVKQRLHKMK